MSRHHWQCEWNLDQCSRDCTCGLTGPRAWWMDYLPADRAPTPEEAQTWRHAIRAKAPPPEHEALAEQFAWTEAGE